MFGLNYWGPNEYGVSYWGTFAPAPAPPMVQVDPAMVVVLPDDARDGDVDPTQVEILG